MSNRPIDCEQALKQVYEYLDHELGGHDHKAMQQHLSICKSCFSRVEFEQKLKEKVQALRDEQPSDSASERIKQLLKGF
jgi:anti-sigma factor (TIGR02949 family)